MADLQHQDSEDSEDIFASAFSSSSGKVKITGEAGSYYEAAAQNVAVEEAQDTGEEKRDPVKAYEKSPVSSNIPNMSPSPYHREEASEPPQMSPVTIGGRQVIHVPPRQSYSSPSPEDEELEEQNDLFIEVSVSEPHKVGEGISSYLAYKVTTKTNLRHFRTDHQQSDPFSVNRRFSDFLGVHEKLTEKYLPRGRVIPPAPEKSFVGTTKVKMSKENPHQANSGSSSTSCYQSNHVSSNTDHDEPSTPVGGSSSATDRQQKQFIARRKERYALERFINRVAQHPVLRKDPVFIEFLESDRDLPRATSTSALSSASVFRLLGRVGDTVNKITYRMEETDPWYEEKTQQIESLENQFKRLHGLVENLVQCRQDLAAATGSFASGTAMLSNAEEAHSLSRALAHLARVEEKVEEVHHRQAEADYFYLLELIRDYVALVGAVKDVLAERSKVFQNWQHAQSMVIKKKEQKARLEMGGRSEKIPAALEEVHEWEARLEEHQSNFNTISAVIKTEIDLFERYRVKDFKASLLHYLESLMTCQLQMVKHWEDFLPEVKSILF